ncbi:MAG: 30S ribosome-binding factor RbfA, partial [Eggerthellaceae bacterium]|nr:30S ribosome-binding factor RbfA [Eggerthellaceae bacterium]
MKQNPSLRKANEEARECIAQIVLFDLSDPRLSMVTIPSCEVTPDKSICNVFYVADADKRDGVASAFEKAGGHIRSLMAQKLGWRITPELRFILDA